MAVDENYLYGAKSVYNKGSSYNRDRFGLNDSSLRTPQVASVDQLVSVPTQDYSYAGLNMLGDNNLIKPQSVVPGSAMDTFQSKTISDGNAISVNNGLQNDIGQAFKTEVDIPLNQNNDALKSDQWISGLDNKDTATLGLGTAQFLLGLGSYFDNQKTSKMNRELLAGQIANNNDLMATRTKRGKDIAGAFGGGTGGLNG